MLSLDISDLSNQEAYQLLSTAIAPRPICFASTIDIKGNVNLSPFSFFNLMSSNPPICVFSTVNRGRDGSAKNTLENVLEVPEVAINIVNYDMVQQTSLASTEYPKGINEFIKAGFTPIASNKIKPPRVKEAPVQLECKVNEVIALGQEGGAGNLIIAEVLTIHIHKNILDENNKIDIFKIDQVARLGGNWYSRLTKDSLFEVAKPLSKLGIGIDALPENIKNSKVLTGNHLGQLGNVEQLPTEDEIHKYSLNPEIKDILDSTIGDAHTRMLQIHLKAAELLDLNRVEEAWKVLLVD
ncbi:flavin reductase family protein [Pedobacter sp. SD-b]|uniref:Flavin reductase family protein n=1 Tax=Pedobacter segetis TaxID=2793069 RepID=A0ABS1BMR2_9SPHI|nr:flavin reductase family protein [Pedobacter segetis]MBK0383484.1 flavin reductase family protein [Pedobacter segetis]